MAPPHLHALSHRVCFCAQKNARKLRLWERREWEISSRFFCAAQSAPTTPGLARSALQFRSHVSIPCPTADGERRSPNCMGAALWMPQRWPAGLSTDLARGRGKTAEWKWRPPTPSIHAYEQWLRPEAEHSPSTYVLPIGSRNRFSADADSTART